MGPGNDGGVQLSKPALDAGTAGGGVAVQPAGGSTSPGGD